MSWLACATQGYRVEAGRLEPIVLFGLDVVVRPDGNLEGLVEVQVEVSEAQRCRAVLFLNPAVKDGDDRLPPRAQVLNAQLAGAPADFLLPLLRLERDRQAQTERAGDQGGCQGEGCFVDHGYLSL